MPLSDAQNQNFFEHVDEMALPHDTVVQLAEEGITRAEDLVDFNEDDFKQVAANLRRPAGQVPDPTAGQPNGAPVGAMMNKQPFVFGAKSQARLSVTAELLRFYRTIGRTPHHNSVRWTVGRNFQEQWKALVDSKAETPPEVPLLGKGQPILKWVETFEDHCLRCYGIRNIPLSYVIRQDAELDDEGPPNRRAGEPFTDTYGSITDDLIQLSSHEHGLFQKDNAAVYFKLEEATRSTPYADSIKPFFRRKHG